MLDLVLNSLVRTWNTLLKQNFNEFGVLMGSKSPNKLEVAHNIASINYRMVYTDLIEYSVVGDS